jgi:hypothetical protein
MDGGGGPGTRCEITTRPWIEQVCCCQNHEAKQCRDSIVVCAANLFKTPTLYFMFLTVIANNCVQYVM